MLNFDVKRKINTLRDILVGKVPDPKAQVEQITIALIYKFMDDMDLEGVEFGGSREFFKEDYEKYAWTNIMQSENSGQQRAILYAEGIDKMSMNPHLPQLFRDIFRGAYVPYRDPETLNMFLKEINEFKYDNSEELGNAFEMLLSIMGSQGDAGQFRTPRHIIDMIVEIVDPQKTDSVLDPACGTAGFLISSYKHILEKNKDKDGNSTLSADDRKRMTNNFAGYDISPDMVRLSRVNMYLHKFAKPQISEYDTLSSLEKWNETYDVILANPPFMTPKGGIIPHNRYRVQAKRAEVLFVDYIAEHLNPTGKAGVIVPEGIVFQSANAYKSLRKFLVEDDLLYAVISLPAGIFNPYSGVKTSILLMDKTFAKQKDEILFVKINNDGYDLGAQRREIAGSDLAEVVRIIKDYIKGLDVSDHDLATVASKKDIAEQDYILVGERYKDVVAHDNKYPMIELGDNQYFFIESGGTPSTSVEEYWDGEIKWVTLVDLPQCDYITEIVETQRHISNSGLKNSSAKLLPEGSVLISSRATIGRIAIAKTQLATNQGFKNIIIQDKSKANSKYIAFAVSNLIPQMINLASGGTFKEISKSNISTLKIPMPPLYIQEAIVKEIEGYQRIIDGAKLIVENYKPTIKIDPSWEMSLLEDIVTIRTGKIDVNRAVENGDYPFFTCAKEPYYINEYAFDCEALLLAGNNATADYDVKHYKGKFNAYQRTYVITIDNNDVKYEYLKVIMDSNLGNLKRNSIGSQTKYLTLGVIKKLSIPIPPLKVQEQIIEEINEEMTIIEQNKRLIEIFEQKIKDKIAEVWGE